VNRGTEQHFIIVANRDLFERLDNFRKKWIADFWDNKNRRSDVAPKLGPELGCLGNIPVLHLSFSRALPSEDLQLELD
jgi:hypothetical protein